MHDKSPIIVHKKFGRGALTRRRMFMFHLENTQQANNSCPPMEQATVVPAKQGLAGREIDDGLAVINLLDLDSSRELVDVIG